jgi:hypothetical protein
MRLRSWVSVSSGVVLSIGLVAAGCANSDGSGDLGNANGSDPSGNSAVGTGATNGSSGAVGTSAGVDGGPGADGASGGTSGLDAAADGAGDAPLPGNDAGPGNTTSTLMCGMSLTCAIPGQLCCITGSTAYACMTGTTCPNVGPNPSAPGSAALACDNSSNCAAGTSCCLDVVAGQSVSSCKVSCATSHAQLCAAFTADPGCPAGVSCSAAHINEFGLSPFFYATCGGVKN